MKLIPNTPYNNKSNAELRVFDAISECFCECENIFAFHSLNIINNPNKITSEADFVILCEHGLFVLEIKGGGISIWDGKWQTRNKKGETIYIQNPFKQASEAFYYISKSIKEKLKIDVGGGYGVVFCDCEFEISSCEWDKNIVCDFRKFKNFERYLKELFDYYRSNILSQEEIFKIGQFLRPNFAFNENDDEIFKQNKNVILICKNEFAKSRFESKIHKPNIVISTIDSLNVSKKRAMIDKFDFLILDEKMDALSNKNIKTLNASLKNELKDNAYCYFCDENFNCKKYLFKEYFSKKNYKNNCKIIEKNITNDYIKALNQEIKSILNNGIKEENITILSPFEFFKSSAFYLDIKITILDSFMLKNSKPKNITFATIKDFEGLENDVIVVIDLNQNFKEIKYQNILAKSQIFFLYNEEN